MRVGEIRELLSKIQRVELRKTINSNLRKQGVSATIASSILGHTAEVNEKHYTYDTSNLFEKKKLSKLEILRLPH